MNRLTSHLPFKAFSAMQWIMLLAIITISSFMALASKAQARSHYIHPFPKAQTISHCGFLPNRNAVYAKKTNPYSHKRNTRIIQDKLEDAGFSVGDAGIDGLYGKDTRHAVMQFQSRYQLEQTGAVGTETSRTLAYLTHPHPNVRRCQRLVRQRDDS